MAALTKEYNLYKINPNLSKEWHPTKNGKLTPSDVTPVSGKKVWWQCKKGHEWQAVIANRNLGTGCPYCANLKVCKDNSLWTKNHALAKEWHPTKNEKLTPKDVTPGSGEKVWWKCKKKHEWQAIISSRNNGVGCPYCANQKAWKENSLWTKNRALAKEWHPTKNGKLTPKDVTHVSGKKVWWKCEKGHEWQVCINSRKNGSGCPYCANRKTCRDNSLWTLNRILSKEWHPTKNGNLTPKDVTPGSNKRVWWMCKKGHEWQAIIVKRNNGSVCPYCASRKVDKTNSLWVINCALTKEWHPTKNDKLTPSDVITASSKKVWWKCKKGHEWQTKMALRMSGSKCPYCTNKKVCKENSLWSKNRTLAKEWHPTKNGNLTPSDVTSASGKKVWWKCKKGHEWQVSINSRRNGSGCPYCTNQKACEDNSLWTKNRALAKEWHPTKNGKLTPKDVTHVSGKKVWWKCKKGHEWQARIAHRKIGTGCPYCANRKICKDNSLLATNRILAKEWHPTKNKKLTPSDVTTASSKKVWWKCKKGHEWQVVIASRNLGTGCPYCANLKVDKTNSLWATNRILAKEWHPSKNGKLTPKDVPPGSAKKVWWQCKKGHEWQAIINCRKNGARCPYCSNKIVCDDNCLATVNRNLTLEWHPTKNYRLTPRDVLGGSNRKVWWMCRHGHEWEAQIRCRNSAYIKNKKGTGCPYCSGRKKLPFNRDI